MRALGDPGGGAGDDTAWEQARLLKEQASVRKSCERGRTQNQKPPKQVLKTEDYQEVGERLGEKPGFWKRLLGAE